MRGACRRAARNSSSPTRFDHVVSTMQLDLFVLTTKSLPEGHSVIIIEGLLEGEPVVMPSLRGDTDGPALMRVLLGWLFSRGAKQVKGGVSQRSCGQEQGSQQI